MAPRHLDMLLTFNSFEHCAVSNRPSARGLDRTLKSIHCAYMTSLTSMNLAAGVVSEQAKHLRKTIMLNDS